MDVDDCGPKILYAQPAYILRGHSAQIHALHFIADNKYLISGDADGWVIIWDMPIKRPVGVWQAHRGAILGINSWPGSESDQGDRIITHGRDNKLRVWQLAQDDISRLAIKLPADAEPADSRQPWLLHSLTVNALNFCSFAISISPGSLTSSKTSNDAPPDVLVAVPGVQDGYINITSLPAEQRFATITDPKDIKTGMVMAIGLQTESGKLKVIAGYESGYACVFSQQDGSSNWQAIYTHKSHTQPVLSLDIAPGLNYFYSSSADEIITRHPLNEGSSATKTLQTKHAGQQSLIVRSDEKIFATAGWDGRARVYSAKTMKELAVLKWHKEGCYALAFATIGESKSSNKLDGDALAVKRNLTVAEQRVQKVQSTHGLAAGSKDGKISLWDVY
ncbi:Astra associated protein 1 Asa1 [Recurvomyces mirabilis]|uniref:ASTRA-associated protein 1 n=1 Tax=Recurvomyces mirabilis TaxID=574656 RepID=A0AAE1C4W3_9PEZI|nr:Astra associated protein 1 Asa1 [Recurvomyces mirabilis]KAK5160644.1 Astra associated protein 1 Asa1 [Recurvomyces mirabilis]